MYCRSFSTIPGHYRVDRESIKPAEVREEHAPMTPRSDIREYRRLRVFQMTTEKGSPCSTNPTHTLTETAKECLLLHIANHHVRGLLNLRSASELLMIRS